MEISEGSKKEVKIYKEVATQMTVKKSEIKKEAAFYNSDEENRENVNQNITQVLYKGKCLIFKQFLKILSKNQSISLTTQKIVRFLNKNLRQKSKSNKQMINFLIPTLIERIINQEGERKGRNHQSQRKRLRVCKFIIIP